MTEKKTGRPLGSHKDESENAAKVLALMAAEPGLSERAAVIRVVGEDETKIRRLQRWLQALREGDPKILLWKWTPDHPVRSNGLVRRIVDITKDEADNTWSIAQSNGPIGTVLVTFKNDWMAPISDAPEHPVFAAVKALGNDYDWDTEAYRVICEKIGIDPDSDRPKEFASFAKASRETVAALKKGLGFSDRRASAMLNVVTALNPLGDGFSPRAVSDVSRLAASSVFEGEEAERLAADARTAFARVDWDRIDVETVNLECLPNPWSYRYDASLFLSGSQGGERDRDSGRLEGGLDAGSMVWWPVFIRAPDPSNLFGRYGAMLMEKHGLAVALSEEEAKSYEAGGDLGVWSARNDWHATSQHRFDARTKRPDLSMTRALTDAMLKSAYGAWVARRTGIAFDPSAKLSCDEREPIAASSPRPPLHVSNDSAFWEHYPNGILGMWAGKIHTRGGDLYVQCEGDRILVRTGSYGIRIDDETLNASFTMTKFVGRGAYWMPDIKGLDFSVIDVLTGKPASFAAAMNLFAMVGARADKIAKPGVPVLRIGLKAAAVVVGLIMMATWWTAPSASPRVTRYDGLPLSPQSLPAPARPSGDSGMRWDRANR